MKDIKMLKKITRAPAELRSLQRRTRLAVQRRWHPPGEENVDEGCYKYGNIGAL